MAAAQPGSLPFLGAATGRKQVGRPTQERAEGPWGGSQDSHIGRPGPWCWPGLLGEHPLLPSDPRVVQEPVEDIFKLLAPLMTLESLSSWCVPVFPGTERQELSCTNRVNTQLLEWREAPASKPPPSPVGSLLYSTGPGCSFLCVTCLIGVSGLRQEVPGRQGQNLVLNFLPGPPPPSSWVPQPWLWGPVTWGSVFKMLAPAPPPLQNSGTCQTGQAQAWLSCRSDPLQNLSPGWGLLPGGGGPEWRTEVQRGRSPVRPHQKRQLGKTGSR